MCIFTVVVRTPLVLARRSPGGRILAACVATLGLACLGLSLSPHASGAQIGSCTPARTALVLAGGGAKGLAHIGLLKTLDSLGIVPDLIVGTSMGSFVGALYASGLSGNEIEEIVKSSPLEAIVRNYEPMVSTSLGGLRPLAVWERDQAKWVLQTGAVRENEVSSLLSRLFLRANLLARGHFDSLPIPFRAVATKLDDRSIVSLDAGDLALAIRASMSLPLLLRPVHLDGRVLVDGGFSSNIPVGVARRLGAERVIVSTIASPKPGIASFDDPFTVTNAVFEFLWVQDSLELREHDVVIAQPTATFAMMNFGDPATDSLVRLGRETADAAFLEARCVRPIATALRSVRLPATVGRARIAASEVRDRDAILRSLVLIPRTPIDLNSVSKALRRFGSEERYRGLWLNPTGDSAHADFDVTIDPAPRRSFGLGVAFDHTMSGRLWVGGVDRELFGRDLEGTALFTTGTYRTSFLLAAGRRARFGERFLPIGGSVEIATEQVRQYQGAGELPSIDTDDITVLAGLRPLFDAGWSAEFGGDYRLWRAPGVPLRGTAGVRFAMRRRNFGSPEPVINFEVIALRAWQSARLDLSRTDSLGQVEVRPRLRVGWGNALPVQYTFPLGGLDGFAGLRLTEQRGDRELFGALLIRWRLWRRLLGRVEPMVGVTSTGAFFDGPGPLDGKILAGGRIGVEIDTPIGPIRIEQGFNNLDRRQALIRVGHWF